MELRSLCTEHHANLHSRAAQSGPLLLGAVWLGRHGGRLATKGLPLLGASALPRPRWTTRRRLAAKGPPLLGAISAFKWVAVLTGFARAPAPRRC